MAISHGWIPTTPAIHPAEGWFMPTAMTQSMKSFGCAS